MSTPKNLLTMFNKTTKPTTSNLGIRVWDNGMTLDGMYKSPQDVKILTLIEKEMEEIIVKCNVTHIRACLEFYNGTVLYFVETYELDEPIWITEELMMVFRTLKLKTCQFLRESCNPIILNVDFAPLYQFEEPCSHFSNMMRKVEPCTPIKRPKVPTPICIDSDDDIEFTDDDLQLTSTYVY